MECMHIYNNGDRYAKHVENMHLVKPRDLMMNPGSYQNVNSYVATSPFPAFPTYNILQTINLQDWFDTNFNKAKENGLLLKRNELLNALVAK